MNVLIVGPSNLSNQLVPWVNKTLQRIDNYGWTLWLLDEPGAAQLVALIADARGMEYHILHNKPPQLISYAGNFVEDAEHFLIDAALIRADIVIAMPKTEKIAEWRRWTRDYERLLIEL